MEPRQITVSLRRDPREIAEKHSQANPLTLRCELARGEAVTEALDLYAELHESRTPASSPLASAGPVVMAAASDGPWDLDFSAAQMNQTVLPGEDKEFWLVIYATGANDLLLTLGTIRLTLAYDNISQVTPAPPEPALILAFRTIAVAGQSSIVADTSADTLTIAAGNGIVLTTNAGTDTITITAAGGAGSGDVTGPAGATDNALARFDGTTGKILQNSTATLSDSGGITADTIAISATPTGAGGTGIFRYDTGEKVPEVGIDGITLKIGVQEYVRVYNATANTLTKGQVVYISGAQGNRVAVQLADASVEATSAGTLGLVAQSITAGSEGFVQVSGPMYNLNTAGLTAGALLYLSETAGQWTQTEPPAPAHGVRLGYVQRVDNNVGSIFIKVDNGYELGELHNVSDGVTGTIAFLVKNLATGIWESKNSSDTRSALGLGTLATQSGTFSGTSSGTNTGDVTLSGQTYLSIIGQAITAAQINLAAHVTGDLPLANLAQAPDPSVILGRRSGSAGDYEPITLGTNLSMSGTVLNASGGGGGAPTDADYLVKTANGSLSAERVVGDSATVSANWTTAGQVSFERAALTGDVTASANSNTTSIASQAVTNAKLAEMAPSTFKGNPTTGTTQGPSDMTAAEAAAILPVFTSSLKGLVPSSGGGTSNFLRADGTFAAPGGVSDGDKGDITVSASGATWTIDAGAVTYAKIQNASANTVIARAASSSGSVGEVALAASRLLGRGSTGDVAAITPGDGLAMSGTTLSATVDARIYSSSTNWTNPSPSTPKPVWVRLIGAGGGGGGGRCDNAGTNRFGGGGGAAGAYVEYWTTTDQLSTTESVTVGAAGTGGAGSSTAGTDGGNGTAGGDTTFGGWTAKGGGGGGGGTGTAGGAAGAGTAGANYIGGLVANVFGASPSSSAGTSSSQPSAPGAINGFVPTAGVGGAGMDSSNTPGNSRAAATVGSSPIYSVTGAAGGTTTAPAGSNGGKAGIVGLGGGGGRIGTLSPSVGIGGNGGNGGNYGGGGSGGGGGTSISGNGGNGGAGYAIIMTFL